MRSSKRSASNEVVMDEPHERVRERVRERLRIRALNLIGYAPRTADELRKRLAERQWAKGHSDLIDAVVEDCTSRGLLGGEGHERALRDRLFAYATDRS